MRYFPELEIDLKKIKQNASEIVNHCSCANIQVCGVIKGCSGLPLVAKAMKDAGVHQLGTSRLEEIIDCIQHGVPGPYLLLRIPGESEIQDLIKYCDYSLQSELQTVTDIDKECRLLNKTHNIIMMIDLGDLREGYWDKEQFINDCCFIEKNLANIRLSGIGVNLGCYGSIKPTPQKMNDLLDVASNIEAKIHRKLDFISGGATTSYTLVHWRTMPNGINHLRIGDNILLSRGLQTNWQISDMNYLDMTAFVIKAEIVEIKCKPSYPQGEFAFNAYGKKIEYANIGFRKRALLSLGNADVGAVSELVLKDDPSISIVGGSSDHTIIDITDSNIKYNIGDIIEFYPRYTNLLHATLSKSVRITYLNK